MALYLLRQFPCVCWVSPTSVSQPGFILSPEYQGYGIGQLLLEKAIVFCKQAQLNQIYLWAFSGLTAARHLYEKFGFVVDEEYTDNAWGNTVTHQKFNLKL